MRNWFRKDGLSKIERRIVDDVDKHGCHIMGVFDPDGQKPQFAYSVGYTKTAEKVGAAPMPEVILFGVPNEVYGPAINELFQMGIGGFEIADGTRIEGFFGDYDCIVRSVHESWLIEEYFAHALWYHRNQMDRQMSGAAMLVWPDSKHVFPWEDGCEDWVREAQPALYEARLDS